MVVTSSAEYTPTSSDISRSISLKEPTLGVLSLVNLQSLNQLKLIHRRSRSCSLALDSLTCPLYFSVFYSSRSLTLCSIACSLLLKRRITISCSCVELNYYYDLSVLDNADMHYWMYGISLTHSSTITRSSFTTARSASTFKGLGRMHEQHVIAISKANTQHGEGLSVLNWD